MRSESGEPRRLSPLVSPQNLLHGALQVVVPYLLNNSFRPTEEIRVLRGYLRQCENLVASAATCIQHTQKALTEMNIQLANVISEISGTTGMAILRDIVRGERDPQKLAMHKHSRIRASRQEIARSLEGTWRQEELFVLEQSLDLYETYQQKIQTCDQRQDILGKRPTRFHFLGVHAREQVEAA